MTDRILWAPWRASFVLAKKEKGCPFCKALKARKDSVKNLIVYRGETCFVVLNKYPYNSGHALVVPNRHIFGLNQLKKAESDEFFEITRLTVRVIKGTLKPHSFNLGMNLGRCSGAGIPEHLHMHIVPRWNGDTNYIPVFAEVRVIPEHFRQTYARLAPHFQALKDEDVSCAT